MCPLDVLSLLKKTASCARVSACVVDFENQAAFVRFDNSSITPDSMIQVGALHSAIHLYKKRFRSILNTDHDFLQTHQRVPTSSTIKMAQMARNAKQEKR